MTTPLENEEAIAERFARSDATPTKPGLFTRLRAEPLLPDAGAAGGPLVAVIAVISFLATLALAVFIFINTAASDWTSDLRRGMTIQVKGESADAIADDVAAALEILRSTSGVIEARALDPEESARLLEPWLGKGNLGDYLVIPALIEVRIDDELRNNIELLETRLAAAAPGAVLDDHGEWQDRLAAAARSGQIVAFGVFALILGAGCAVTIFAARAGLAANREIVSILHLVGATDRFVASQVQRRFTALALRGSIAGLAAAVVAIWAAAAAASIQGGLFAPGVEMNAGLALVLIVVPLVLTLATATTARITVLRSLAQEL